MAEIFSTDLFLVNREGKSYQLEQQNILGRTQPEDIILINRAGKSYQVSSLELRDSVTSDNPIVKDDDLLLLNRGNKSYKTTFLDLKNSIKRPPEIGSIVLRADTPDSDNRFTNEDFTATIDMDDDGVPLSTKAIRARLLGSLNIPIETDIITAVDTITGRGYSDGDIYGSPQNPIGNSKWTMDQGFDGNLNTPVSSQFTTGTPYGVNFTPPVEFNAGDKLEVYCIYKNQVNTIKVNKRVKNVNQGQWNDMTECIGNDGAFTSIETQDLGNFDNPGGPGKWCQFSGVRINGEILIDYKDRIQLTFASGLGLDKLQVGDTLTQSTGDGTGVIREIDLVNNTILFTSTTGTWTANGTNIAIGPLANFDGEQSYLNLDSNLNVIGLVDTADFTAIPSNSLTPKIQFPAQLDNGRSPDETLVDGTSIQVEVKAINTEGEFLKFSNVVTPGTPCVNGPIETARISDVDEISGDWVGADASNNTVKWNSVAYGDGKYIAVSNTSSATNQVMVSSDAVTWTDSSPGVAEANAYYGAFYANGLYLVCGSQGRVQYSSDGNSWTPLSLYNTSTVFHGFAYGNGVYVVAGASGGISGAICYSSDGKNWSNKTTNINTMIEMIAFGNGTFVAMSPSTTSTIKKIWWSIDGNYWTGQMINPEFQDSNLKSIAFGQGLFVACASGGTNRILYSTDGKNWSAANTTFAQTQTWWSVTASDDSFVCVATTGESAYSSDGINWSLTTPQALNQWRGVTFGDGKYVSVASNGTQRVQWSYSGGPDSAVLTFENPTGLNELNIGDAVEQEDTAASGTIKSIDIPGSSMFVEGDGTWGSWSEAAWS